MKKYIIPNVEMEERVVSYSFIMTSPEAPLTPANGPGNGLRAPERKPF